MRRSIYLILIVLTCVWGSVAPAGSGGGGGGGGTTDPEITGMMGVVPALENSCAAIWLPIPEGQAVTGLRWFNNDGTLAFPGIYLESGDPEQPVALAETVLMAENVLGQSGDWSEVQFSEPVSCASEGLYVLFRFPEGIEVSDFGTGGGPAIGYVTGEGGAPGWLCADGESWTRIDGTYGFAVIPQYVDAEPGMLQLNGGAQQPEAADVPSYQTALLLPAPNPFNPQTEITFTLAADEMVEMDVYDVRGRRVAELASGRFAAGLHTCTWNGRDVAGRGVASGVYFVRFRAGSIQMHHRLALVR